MSQDKITDDSYGPFIRGLLQRGHTSVLEFASFHVEVLTSRDVMAELTRHRHSSFAIQSQRYVAADRDTDVIYIQPEFWLAPDDLATDPKRWCASRKWEELMSSAEKAYSYMRHEAGQSPQDARKVLPNSHACIINTRANLRQWLSIFELRCAPGVYPEMRKLMLMIRDEFDRMFPELRVKEVAQSENH